MTKKIPIAAIVLLAVVIRLYPVAAKLPYTFWHDENSYIEMALRFGSGRLDMLTYAHGSFYPVLLLAIYGVCFLAFKLAGVIATSSDFYAVYLKDPTLFFVAARAVSVFCGAGISYISYLLSRKAYGERAGLASAAFCALSLIMVQMSSVALADMLSIFLLLSSVFLMMRSMDDEGGWAAFLAGSLVAGLAAGCKYYSFFAGASLMAVSYFNCRREGYSFKTFIRYPVAGAFLMASGALIAMPFFILKFGAFYQDTFVDAVGEYIVRNPNRHTWLFYFTHHLRNALGVPLEILAIAGLVHAFIRRSRYDIVLAVFPVAYYLLLMHSVSFAYHMLPAIPFLLILAGRSADSLSRFITKRYSAAALTLIVAAVLLPTAMDSIKYVRILAGPDTRTEALGWIEMNVPSGESFISEGNIAAIPSHAVPLKENMDTLKRDLERTLSKNGTGLAEKLKIERYYKDSDSAKGYDIFKTSATNTEEADSLRPAYIIMSGANDIVTGDELSYYIADGYHEGRDDLRRHISRDYELVRVFDPYPVMSSVFPHMVDRDYRAIRSASLNLMDRYISGPRIEIYRRR